MGSLMLGVTLVHDFCFFKLSFIDPKELTQKPCTIVYIYNKTLPIGLWRDHDAHLCGSLVGVMTCVR